MDAINKNDRQWAIAKFITVYLLLTIISWFLWYTNRKAEDRNKETCEKCKQEVKDQLVELDQLLLLIKFIDSSLQSKANIISTNDEQEARTANSMLSLYNENVYKISKTKENHIAEVLEENTKKIDDLKNLLFQLHINIIAQLNTVNDKRPKVLDKSILDEKLSKKEEDLSDTKEDITKCKELIKEKNDILVGMNEDLSKLIENIKNERKYKKKVLDKILEDAIKEIENISSDSKKESRKSKF